jgi:hypothetical protein
VSAAGLAVLIDDFGEAGTNHRVRSALQGGETVTMSIERIAGFTVTVQERPRRRWERGVYTGDDSPYPAVARQRLLERRVT